MNSVSLCQQAISTSRSRRSWGRPTMRWWGSKRRVLVGQGEFNHVRYVVCTNLCSRRFTCIFMPPATSIPEEIRRKKFTFCYLLSVVVFISRDSSPSSPSRRGCIAVFLMVARGRERSRLSKCFVRFSPLNDCIAHEYCPDFPRPAE